MLAFQDYTNAVNKNDQGSRFLESIITDVNNEIKELSEQITDEKKELDRLRRTTKSTTNIEILDEQFDALRARLVAAGFDVEPGRPDAALCAAGGPSSRRATGTVKTVASGFLSSQGSRQPAEDEGRPHQPTAADGTKRTGTRDF